MMVVEDTMMHKLGNFIVWMLNRGRDVKNRDVWLGTNGLDVHCTRPRLTGTNLCSMRPRTCA